MESRDERMETGPAGNGGACCMEEGSDLGQHPAAVQKDVDSGGSGQAEGALDEVAGDRCGGGQPSARHPSIPEW